MKPIQSWNAEQTNNAKIIRDAWLQNHSGDVNSVQAVVIAFMTSMQEASLKNLDYGPDSSIGLFQQQTAYYGTGVRDPRTAAIYFFDGYQDKNGLVDIDNWPNMPAGDVCQKIQISAYPDRYAQWETNARNLLANIGMTGGVEGGIGGGGGSDMGPDGSSSGGVVVPPPTVVDVTSKPYRFNPNLHQSLMPKRIDYASDSASAVTASLKYWDRELQEKSVIRGAKDPEGFRSLRQGRIVMANESLSFAGQTDYRWGFRFLYNPETLTGGQSVRTDIIPNPNDIGTYMLQQGLETITFKLLLNRTPDVMGPVPQSDYLPPIQKDDYAGIQQRGTGWDLEYLYRICNGTWDTNTRAKTGDVGFLLPNPAELILGPGLRYYGAIAGVSVNNILFSPNMVPLLTFVDLTFSCYVNLLAADVTDFLDTTGLSSIDADNVSTAGTAGGANDDDPGEGASGSLGPSNGQDSNSDGVVSVPNTSKTQRVNWNDLKTFVRHDAQLICNQFNPPTASTYQPSGAMASDHPSLAVDFMIGTSQSLGNRIATYAKGQHDALKLSYVIWNRKIISGKDNWSSWRPYNGTNPHTDHVHLSWKAR